MPELSDVSKHYAHGDLTEAKPGLPVEVLCAFGDSVSRVNVLKQATSLEGVELLLLLPGMTVTTAPDGLPAVPATPLVAIRRQELGGARRAAQRSIGSR
jgi:hypothetical protein